MVYEVLLLSGEEVASLLEMKDILEIVEEAFRLIEDEKASQLNNTSLCKIEEGFSFMAFPCFVEQKIAGVKWISYNQENRKRRLPTISAILVLNDIETGIPISIMDASWITAKRTGAVAAIAAKYLARKDAATISIIGCGVEGRSHTEALSELFKIEKILAYNRSKAGAEKFAHDIKVKLDLPVEITNSPRNAAKASDIICMTTTAQNPLITSEDAEEGCLIIGTSSFRDLDPRIRKEVDKWILGNTQIDFPHLIKSSNATTLSRADVYGDLGEIIAGKIAGRETENERILFTCGGMGVFDVCAGLLVYNRAKKGKVGTNNRL